MDCVSTIKMDMDYVSTKTIEIDFVSTEYNRNINVYKY